MNVSPAPAADSFERLCVAAAIDAPALLAARERSRKKLDELARLTSEVASEDVSLIVFGSLARLEFTSGSDLDWTLLVDGQTSPSDFERVARVADLLVEAGFKKPGREGTFGNLISSHDLVHYIGGSDDYSANQTRRLLLLLESAPLGRDEAYRRTVRSVLDRYVSEDFGWMHARNTSNVPRFLQNDISRFWRTMAVDFAYKRRDRAGEGWAIRTAKLRMSRKLIYASGLAMCFGCALDPEIAGLKPSLTDRSAVVAVIAYLERYVRATPLDNLAALALSSPELFAAAKQLIENYDGFVALLDDDVRRRRLEDLKQPDVSSDDVYESVRELSTGFQRALEQIFLSERLLQLTQTYGIF